MRGLARRSWVAAAVLAAIVAVPSAAAGQERDPGTAAPAPRPVGTDIVYLKDGGMVRGTMVDVLPGAQARIQLVTGEIDTFVWAEIDHIERGAAPGPAARAPAAAPSEVVVHVDAPEGVVVQQDVTNDDDWQTVCTAPCDKPLSPAFHYRVTGGGIKSSGDFTIDPSQPHENLVIDGASKSAFILSIVAMAGGVVVAYLGLIVTYAGELESLDTLNGSQGAVGTGLAMMALGAGAAVVGLVVAVSNGRTHVTHASTQGQARIQPRVPSWADSLPLSPAVAERRLLPPIAGIPLLSGRF